MATAIKTSLHTQVSKGVFTGYIRLHIEATYEEADEYGTEINVHTVYTGQESDEGVIYDVSEGINNISEFKNAFGAQYLAQSDFDHAVALAIEEKLKVSSK